MKINKIPYFIVCILLILPLFVLLECGGTSDSGAEGETYSVTVSWNSNPETLVNKPGGGYRVYYSKKPGFSLNDPDVLLKEIIYVSGSQSPTSTILTLENGTWYIKIIAFMELNGECTSQPSVEKSISLP